MAVIIDTGELLQTVLASVVAGIGITTVASIGIWAAARLVDLSSDRRPVAAAAAGLLAVAALALTLAGVVFGIIVMTHK